jgi:hypothetical protein
MDSHQVLPRREKPKAKEATTAGIKESRHALLIDFIHGDEETC